MPTLEMPGAGGHELGLKGLVDLAAGYQRAQVLFSANELGVFRTLATGSRSITELAASLNLDARALAPLLDACAALDLLRREGPRYANTRTTSLFLGRGNGSFAPVLRFWKQLSYGVWGRLTDAVANNLPQTSEGPKHEDLFEGLGQDEAQLEIFFAGLHGLARWPARRLAEVVDLSDYAHLVDLGGGSGAYAEALLERYPQLRVTLFDLAPGCGVARRRFEGLAVGDRLGIQEGDFHTDELPACDALLLSNVLHDWAPDEIVSLLRKTHRTLRPGGLLIIHDFMPEAETATVEAAMFSLALLLDTKRGRVYTREEHQRWLAEVGYGETRDEEISTGTRVMTTRKAMA